MKKTVNIVCRGLSLLLYPMLIPTYGMVLFCRTFSATMFPMPAGYQLTVCAATLFFTCLIPLSLILFLKQRGIITDLYLEDRRQRLRPYLYSLTGFIFWCIFVGYTLHAPAFLLWTAIGGTIALGVIMLVNLRWKISAHLCGMGGLTGGIVSYCLANGIWAPGSISLLLFISLLLMFARICLQAHTAEQTVAGYLVGLLCTTTPNLIIYV
jgi:hypothetical protein